MRVKEAQKSIDRAARILGMLGSRITSYGHGPDVLRLPPAMVEIAHSGTIAAESVSAPHDRAAAAGSKQASEQAPHRALRPHQRIRAPACIAVVGALAGRAFRNALVLHRTRRRLR